MAKLLLKKFLSMNKDKYRKSSNKRPLIRGFNVSLNSLAVFFFFFARYLGKLRLDTLNEFL